MISMMVLATVFAPGLGRSFGDLPVGHVRLRGEPPFFLAIVEIRVAPCHPPSRFLPSTEQAPGQ
jgi:hypothetical protein